ASHHPHANHLAQAAAGIRRAARGRRHTARRLVLAGPVEGLSVAGRSEGGLRIRQLRLRRRQVFNIGGNKYRLGVSIRYRTGIVYLRRVLTHAEYARYTSDGTL